MICFFCRTPIVVPGINYPKDVEVINVNVSKATQRVACINCGALFDIDTFVARKPRLDEAELKKIANKVR